MKRIVEPELLDQLPADHPDALRSRWDLRRVNALIGNSRILANSLLSHLPQLSAPHPLLRIVEVGAGDGTVLLSVAQRLSKRGVAASVTMIDRQPAFANATRHAFAVLGWQVNYVVADVLAGLEQTPPAADVIIANMFLHQFPDEVLSQIFEHIQDKTSLFLACEPARSKFTLMAGRLLGLMGCSATTRHDGMVSIRAGFQDQELSCLWPHLERWHVAEGPAGLFAHCFGARRRVARTPPGH